MKYQIDTIPVWEAIEFSGPCLLCTLRVKTEREEIDRILGASVMEPDVRVETNAKGFCKEHQQQLFARQNRLGHALLIDTHAQEALSKVNRLHEQSSAGSRNRKTLFASQSDALSIASGLRDLTSHCVICERLDQHMSRYIYTILHLWKTDASFRDRFAASNGICLPHTADLIEAAHSQIKRSNQHEFIDQCFRLLSDHLAADESDLHWFTQKFDYKNQDKPWGNSKDAIERTVNRLRGYCIGDAPLE